MLNSRSSRVHYHNSRFSSLNDKERWNFISDFNSSRNYYEIFITINGILEAILNSGLLQQGIQGPLMTTCKQASPQDFFNVEFKVQKRMPQNGLVGGESYLLHVKL